MTRAATRTGLGWVLAASVLLLPILALPGCSPDDGGGGGPDVPADPGPLADLPVPDANADLAGDAASPDAPGTDALPDNPDPGPCEPGAVAPCGCAVGFGSRSCAEDGSGFGECVCHTAAARVRDNVLVIAGAKARGLVVDRAEHAARLPLEGNEDLLELQRGDMVVIQEPPGFFGMVRDVGTYDGKVQIAIKNVPLNALFEELDFSASAPALEVEADVDLADMLPVPAAMTSLAAPDDLPPFLPAPSVEAFKFRPRVSLECGSSLSIVPPDPTKLCSGILPDCDVDCELTWKVWEACDADCEWHLDEVDCENLLKLFDPTVGWFWFGCGAWFDLDMELKGTFPDGANVPLFEKKVIEDKYGPVWYVMGVPFQLVYSFPFTCELSISPGQTVDLRAQHTFSPSFDVSYDGSWSSSFSGGSAQTPNLRIALGGPGAVEIECGIHAHVDLEIAHSGGPYLDAGPYASFEVDPTPPRATQAVGGRITIGGVISLIGVELFSMSRVIKEWETVLWERVSECDREGAATCRPDGKSFAQCGHFDDDPFLDLSADVTACPAGGSCAKGFSCTGGCGACKPTDRLRCRSTDGCYLGWARCNEGCSGFEDYCELSGQGCGNGDTEGCEACDGDRLPCSDGCYDGEQGCVASCGGFRAGCDPGAQACGNGVREGCERCDRNDTEACFDGCYDGWRPCAGDCRGFGAGCDVHGQRCGNGVVEGCEQCDGPEPAPCVDPATGFRGVRACTASCTWAAACVANEGCGDGIVNGRERCDDADTSACGACDATCTGPGLGGGVCGNGVKECDEGCDDADRDDCTGGCAADCSGPRLGPLGVPGECGDGQHDPLCERCEDTAAEGARDAGCPAGRPNCHDCNRCVPDRCGDGVRSMHETCDDGNAEDGDGCSADCSSDETCGNSVVDPAVGEVCDDGDREPGDGCAADCRSDETCGNGVVDLAMAEACDDGNTWDGDGCSADCGSDETCGNGTLDPVAGEVCDDGFREDGDGCSADCLSDESCGNGIPDPGEVCEDGNTEPCDGCSAECDRVDAVCGDTIQECGEACDEGDTSPCGACNPDCTGPGWFGGRCGNGSVECDEACDDGDLDACTTGCDETCAGPRHNLLLEQSLCGDGWLDAACEACEDSDPENTGIDEGCDGALPHCQGCAGCTADVCGDGTAGPTEVCDDANTRGGDGCRGDCRGVEACGDALLDPLAGEVCDDGDTDSLDGCRGDCRSREVCGNRVLDDHLPVPEVCDDGNTRDGDGCSADCRSDETCGNGVLDRIWGELCDDGDQDDGDGCSADCRSDESCGNRRVDVAVGEVCDDGNTRACDGCSSDCLREERAVCGDAVTECGEACDDGAKTPCGDCNATCTGPGLGVGTCGNGVRECAEACDDGDRDDCTAGCKADCGGVYANPAGAVARCGDGWHDPACEACEDTAAENTRIDAGCTALAPNCAGCAGCVPDRCGDGVLGTTESCDDGNVRACDGCAPDCGRRDAVCGDAVRECGEVCDDGNRESGDGCRADCGSNETCGNRIVDTAAEEVCDDGNTAHGDGCSADCRSNETCGNAVVDYPVGETCDDGDRDSGDGCRADCRSDERCGNGVRDTHLATPEVCDDGNTDDCDGCAGDCRRRDRICGDRVVECGEPCDDGFLDACGSCNGTCTAQGGGSTCGDGQRCLETEACDDFPHNPRWMERCASGGWTLAAYPSIPKSRMGTLGDFAVAAVPEKRLAVFSQAGGACPTMLLSLDWASAAPRDVDLSAWPAREDYRAWIAGEGELVGIALNLYADGQGYAVANALGTCRIEDAGRSFRAAVGMQHPVLRDVGNPDFPAYRIYTVTSKWETDGTVLRHQLHFRVYSIGGVLGSCPRGWELAGEFYLGDGRELYRYSNEFDAYVGDVKLTSDPPRAYVAVGETFRVFDISSDLPKPLFQMQIPYADHVFLSDRHVFVGTSQGELHVLDRAAVDAGTAAAALYKLSTGGDEVRVAGIAGDRLYVTWKPTFEATRLSIRRLTGLDEQPPGLPEVGTPGSFQEGNHFRDPAWFRPASMRVLVPEATRTGMSFTSWSVDEAGKCNDTCEGVRP